MALAMNNKPVLRAIGLVLPQMPSQERLVEEGMFYFAKSLDDSGRARVLLEAVAEDGCQIFRAKAQLALGNIEAESGNHHSALSLYDKAIKESDNDPQIVFHTLHNKGWIFGSEGRYRLALDVLAEADRLGHYVHPVYRLDNLNNVAVELAALGKNDEAEEIASVLTVSPFIDHYPAWKETVREIRQARRIQISVPEFNQSIESMRSECVDYLTSAPSPVIVAGMHRVMCEGPR